MLTHRPLTAAALAAVAILLGTANADAGPFGVSVGVGPGGVSVSVGRGPVYYGYSSVVAPAYPYYYSSRYFQYGWGNYPFYPGVYSPPSYLNVYPPPGFVRNPSRVGDLWEESAPGSRRKGFSGTPAHFSPGPERFSYKAPPPGPGGVYSYRPPTVPTVPQVGGYQSFYPPQQPTTPTQPTPSQPYALPAPRPTTPPAQDPNSVLLNVRLPEANAELLIDGTRATRQGTTRQFISPPLTPGKRYSYDLQARWTDNGREVSQSRRVIVEAGQQLNIDFTQPPRPGEEVGPPPALP